MFTKLLQDIGYGSEAWTLKKKTDERDYAHLKLNINAICNSIINEMKT
jgi:hypothetical protein